MNSDATPDTTEETTKALLRLDSAIRSYDYVHKISEHIPAPLVKAALEATERELRERDSAQDLDDRHLEVIVVSMLFLVVEKEKTPTKSTNLPKALRVKQSFRLIMNCIVQLFGAITLNVPGTTALVGFNIMLLWNAGSLVNIIAEFRFEGQLMRGQIEFMEKMSLTKKSLSKQWQGDDRSHSTGSYAESHQ